MPSGSKIVSVTAREIYSNRGHPGVEATVTTESGAVGVAIATAGVSVGVHEVQFAYDGGERFKGRGVLKAIDNVANVIAPAITGLDAADQRAVDEVIIELDGTPNKTNLGGNATAATSAAVLKAGAASLGIPLYRHIGGVNACILPVPGEINLVGSKRYGGGERSGGKPSHSFICYGFDTFADASYACWQLSVTYARLLMEKFNIDTRLGWYVVGPGVVKHDSELWDVMVEAINSLGYEGKVGIQVDVAAGTYWEKDKERFVGLFSAEDKTRDDLIELYKWMLDNYPFVVIEDPLDEDDYEGHAIVTNEVNVEVVGDDLFTTNPERLQQGIDVGACTAVLLKVNQIGTISEAFDVVNLAYRNGWGVMPCNSRGEGVAIADYCVGLGTGHLREGGTGEVGNRFLQIEQELGSRAQFLGKKGLKLRR